MYTLEASLTLFSKEEPTQEGGRGRGQVLTATTGQVNSTTSSIAALGLVLVLPQSGLNGPRLHRLATTSCFVVNNSIRTGSSDTFTQAL